MRLWRRYGMLAAHGRFCKSTRLRFVLMDFGRSKDIDLNKKEATVEVFWMAFDALPIEEKRAFLQRIIRDNKLRRDLMDLALVQERHDEPERPLHEYLKEKKN